MARAAALIGLRGAINGELQALPTEGKRRYLTMRAPPPPTTEVGSAIRASRTDAYSDRDTGAFERERFLGRLVWPRNQVC